MFFVRRSTTPTVRSQTFCNWKRQTSAKLSRVHANISQMADEHPLVRASNDAFWRHLSVPHKKGTWQDSRVSLRKTLSLTPMAVGLCVQRGSQSPVANVWRSSLPPLLHTSGRA